MYREVDDRLLSTDQVSNLLGVPEVTLRDWRYRGRGPKWVRLSPKMIRYWRSDVHDWIDQQDNDDEEEEK